MGWHVLSSTYFDFDRFGRESQDDKLPHHLLPMIAERLGAKIHQPSPDAGSWIDRLASRIYGRPEHWALARIVSKQLRDGDAVHAAGCDIGIPVALLCAARRRDVRFSIAFIHPDRTRTKVLGRVLASTSLTLTALVTTDQQAEDLKRSFGKRLAGVHAIHGQTDCDFFRPSDARVENSPPLVASCGVEQRDYDTMSKALADEEVEALVCFASPNHTSKTRFTMPDNVPANFEFGLLEFADLRDLYQRADLVMLPLLYNRYSAGLSTLFEAIACGAPVVVTETPGIIAELVAEDLVLGVPAGDERAVRSAVAEVLANPDAAAERAERARKVVLDRYSATSFLDLIEGLLVGVEAPVSAP